MTRDKKYLSIEEVRDYLNISKKGKFNLFIGSAVSEASPTYAPGVWSIKERIAKELIEDLQDTHDLKKKVFECLLLEGKNDRYYEMAYESLWYKISNATTESFVRNTLNTLYGKKSPNHNHKAIAEMIKCGMVNAVFTTNYDEYIEQELKKKQIHH